MCQNYNAKCGLLEGLVMYIYRVTAVMLAGLWLEVSARDAQNPCSWHNIPASLKTGLGFWFNFFYTLGTKSDLYKNLSIVSYLTRKKLTSVSSLCFTRIHNYSQLKFTGWSPFSQNLSEQHLLFLILLSLLTELHHWHHKEKVCCRHQIRL